MRLSPSLHKAAIVYSAPVSTEDNIDFWYDSLNDCYENGMEFRMIALYVEAINDEG